MTIISMAVFIYKKQRILVQYITSICSNYKKKTSKGICHHLHLQVLLEHFQKKQVINKHKTIDWAMTK